LESAVLRASAPPPTPVLKLAVVAVESAYQPTPVFPAPVVSKLRALHPSAVVNPGYHPSGGGTTARNGSRAARETNVSNKTDGVIVFIPRVLKNRCRVVEGKTFAH